MRPMRRWLIRTGAAALIILAAAALGLWLTLRASLPQLDGQVTAAGLGDTATIERDSAGIPTITARTRADLAYATGFAHGQDRFFQMDLIRRRAAGELSELFGELAIDFDKRYRFHRFRHRADAVLAAVMTCCCESPLIVNVSPSTIWLLSGATTVID